MDYHCIVEQALFKVFFSSHVLERYHSKLIRNFLRVSNKLNIPKSISLFNLTLLLCIN